MSISTCAHFEAGSDLSLIRFSTGFAGCAVFQLRFAPQQPDVYDAVVEYLHNFPDDMYMPLTDRQVEQLLMAMAQMIELYTQKYPERVIRLKGGGGKLQSMLFRVMLLVHQEALRPWFTIEEQQQRPVIPFFNNRGVSTFFLRRRPDACLPAHPVQTRLVTQSRLFGNPVFISLIDV